MRYIIELLFYFLIYSLAGWVLESVLKTVTQKKFVNSGFLVGPFCPIYGVGATVLITLFSKWKDNYFLIFFASFFFLSLLEYLIGWYLETVFQTRYWDYSYHRWNYKGRVCLLHSTIWAILGTLFLCFLHPKIAILVSPLSDNILIYLTILLSAYFLTDCVLSIVQVKKTRHKKKNVQEMREILQEKTKQLEKLKKQRNSKQIEIGSLQKEIGELQLKQWKWEKSLKKRQERLKRAFPNQYSIKKRTNEKKSKLN